MKNKLILFVFLAFNLATQAQIIFEEGHLIKNNGERIDCLIKNEDWENNPFSIEIRRSENSNIERVDIEEIREFSIHNASKYIKAKVNIDRTSDRLKNYDREKAPKFSEEILLLKVLLTGKYSLYTFKDKYIRRFFFKTPEQDIEQLIYKKYKKTETQVAENNHYKQQLLTSIDCPEITLSEINFIKYKLKSLVKFLKKINSCEGSSFEVYVPEQNQGSLNLNVRARLSYNDLLLRNRSGNLSDLPFDNNIGYGFGAEAEYILPFNKDKWAFALEATYESYTSDTQVESDNVVGGILKADIDFSYIQLELKLRHYLFLNANNKFFINISYIMDTVLDESLTISRNNDIDIITFDLDPRPGPAFGLGYKFLDKFSAEIRYRNISVLNNSQTWDTNHDAFSLIFGYTLF